MPQKTYLFANDITRDSFVLARKIYDSGFRPDAVLALWRGGTPIGIAIQEFLKVKGVKCYHTAVKCTSYTGIEESGEPVVENIESVMRNIGPDTKVLVVDDIFDTGRTAKCMRDVLTRRTPHVRIATLYFKPSRNTTDMVPDYYVHSTDKWIVFPHEIDGLTEDEIREKDAFLHHLLFS